MKGNIVYMPAGNLHSREVSKRLEFALRDFILQQGASFYDDRADEGIYATYFRLKNGICVQQQVTVGKYDYLCKTTLSCQADKTDQKMLTSLCLLVNVLNCEIDYGNFEVDLHTGEISFKTYVVPGDVIYDEDLHRLLGCPIDRIEEYGQAFLDVLASET